LSLLRRRGLAARRGCGPGADGGDGDPEEPGGGPPPTRTRRRVAPAPDDQAEQEAGDQAAEVAGVVDVPAREAEDADPHHPADVVAGEVARGVAAAQREPDRDADQAADRARRADRVAGA